MKRRCLRCEGKMEFGRLMDTMATNVLNLSGKPASLMWAAESQSILSVFQGERYGMPVRAYMCQRCGHVEVVGVKFINEG